MGSIRLVRRFSTLLSTKLSKDTTNESTVTVSSVSTQSDDSESLNDPQSTLPAEILEYILNFLLEEWPEKRKVRIDASFQPDPKRLFQLEVQQTFAKESQRCDPAYMTNTIFALQPVLAAASTVCHEWAQICQCLLYRNIVITRSKALHLFLRTLEEKSVVRDTVQSVLFISPPLIASKKGASDTDNQVLHKIYALCPYISVHVTGNASRKRSRFSQLFSPDVDPPPISELRSIASALTRLEITNKSRTHINTCLPPFTLPLLQDLVLTGCCMEETMESFVHQMTDEYVEEPGPFVWPNLPSLRRLALRDCTISLNFSLPRLPKLVSLEVLGGNILAYFTFIATAALQAPNIEYLSIMPTYRGNANETSSPSCALTLDFYYSIVHLRISTKVASILPSYKALPIHLQRLDIIEMTPLSEEGIKANLKCIRGVLGAKGKYRELQAITVITTQDSFFHACYELGCDVSNRDIVIHIELYGTKVT